MALSRRIFPGRPILRKAALRLGKGTRARVFLGPPSRSEQRTMGTRPAPLAVGHASLRGEVRAGLKEGFGDERRADWRRISRANRAQWAPSPGRAAIGGAALRLGRKAAPPERRFKPIRRACGSSQKRT
jgi:hypothetical protein